MNFADAKFFSNKQKASQFLVSLPRKLYNISTKWEVREHCPLPESKLLKPQENKKGCLTSLNGKLSDISQEIVDLEHYIEFSKLNACEAYHAYKMLQDTLKKRRKIKDSITAAQSLYENCDVDKLSSCNDYLHNRTYNPRKLTALFK